MMTPAKREEDIERASLTVGSLAKIVIAIVFIIGYSIGVYAWVDNIDSKTKMFIQEQKMLHKQQDEQAIAFIKALDEYKRNQEDMKKVQSELIRALDKTTIILEQINKNFDSKRGLTP